MDLSDLSKGEVQTGEAGGEASGSSLGATGISKPVGKLADEAYQPWGTNSNSSSRSNSDVGSDADKSICKGGPGKESCGELVEDGVTCDMCGFSFHPRCQQVPKPAVSAVKKYPKALSWFCATCKPEVRSQSGSCNKSTDSCGIKKQVEALDKTVQDHIKMIEPVVNVQFEVQTLEAKVDQLELSVRRHVKLVESSMREQEKAASDQLVVLKKSFEQQTLQKTSYADMLKSTCSNVLKEVNTKLDAIPKPPPPKEEAKIAHDMSCILDDYLDKEKRKLNVVVHNLPEEIGETASERSAKDQAAFQTLVMEGLKLRINTTKSFRAGRKMADKPRLLIVTMDSVEAKVDLLSLVSQLKETRYKHIYINPDLTKLEREEGKKLRAELKSRREAGERNLTIRRGKVVSLALRSATPPKSNKNQNHTTSGVSKGVITQRLDTDEVRSD